MKQPEVLNKYRSGIPNTAKYIGRGSPYGNPYVIGKDGTREDVIRKFEEDILPSLGIEPLRGYDLVCFCAPQACHGDSILKKLNNDELVGG